VGHPVSGSCEYDPTTVGPVSPVAPVALVAPVGPNSYTNTTLLSKKVSVEIQQMSMI